MERIWLQSYEPGVPADIDPDKYTSLNEMFFECFEKYRSLPAFTNMGQIITYATLEQDSKAFAMFLRQTLKLEKGARVAIMMPNVLQYPVCMLGILMAGCTVVNVNPLYTPDELLHQMNDSQTQAIVVLENFAHTVAAVIKDTQIKHVVVARISDIFHQPKATLVNFVVKYIKHMVPAWNLDNFYWYKDAIKLGSAIPFTQVQVKNADIAFLQYTGGTTGKAKGAMLTHRNMVANMEQAAAWLSQMLGSEQEIIITALPLYHIFSLTANCLTFIRAGALNVLVTNPRDTKAFIKDLKRYKFTTLTGVNTLFNLLLNQPDFATVDFSRLKLCLGGGMQVQEVVAKRWQDVTKCRLLEAYGLTECAPAVCINPMNLNSYNGSIGLPVPSTEVSIRDENRNEVEIGKEGELWVRGPQVMLGYWNQPTETANVLFPDGWLRTGDVATIDAKGFVRIVDRIKDVINVSGFKVFPNEIEGVLVAMPGILEASVVGVPDPNHGEAVKAFIVRKDPDITEKKVRAYCHEHLTGYKIPSQIEFRDSLPKNNVGKILRRLLRHQ
jgi:long-chain acyl-CoA synthetase